ncbi:restriction system modified-DNA reader domain-containing protein [Kitasatospora purpeofusca]|uniref:restriction system modified-DNA reader domain-containing protein n=1 Tax=Kitasatospora purpeofusca TaxID=67352 RepID=UPI0022554BAD|nr:hypothetical protein [Kitasatospora purpeofusca]MCX4682730.1 hypothetical protein [Kitasatospora purpeofusca]MCX4690606.1 hypothetical protein [Kitasatospora purpeofusca]MCX4690788.1 hypothetical protein [Kitasatospora purpeofusca]
MIGEALTMVRIEIDAEVFAFLQENSEPLVDTPNTVLRRLLLEGTAAVQGGADEQPGRGPGALMPFLERGWIKPDEALHHVKKRTGQTFHAKVTPDGWIRIADGREFALPSPALKAQVGTEINGWGQYTVLSAGKPLQFLREQLRLAQLREQQEGA